MESNRANSPECFGPQRARPPRVLVKLLEGAQMPTRGSNEAAGFDVYANEDKVVHPHECVTVRTGLILDIPKGWFIQVNPRTGLAVKHGIGVLAGVVDSDYRGEVDIILFNISGTPYSVKRGDRIAQFVVMPCAPMYVADGVTCRYDSWTMREVTSLEGSSRGSGRFGSTGK